MAGNGLWVTNTVAGYYVLSSASTPVQVAAQCSLTIALCQLQRPRDLLWPLSGHLLHVTLLHLLNGGACRPHRCCCHLWAEVVPDLPHLAHFSLRMWQLSAAGMVGCRGRPGAAHLHACDAVHATACKRQGKRAH